MSTTSFDKGVGARYFVVTTSRSVLLLDAHTKRLQRVHSGSGLYYGIDVSADRILVAARHRMVSSDMPAELESGEILVFDHALNFVDALRADFPLRDMHQIREHAGALYVTCPFDNLIAICEAGLWQRWFPLGCPPAPPWDVNHFNTLEIIDGALCVVAHNNGDSEVLVFDVGSRSLQSRVSLGVQAHNVWKHGREWCTCSSAAGRIVGDMGFEIPTGGFPRGVCIGNTFSIVGVSQLAEKKDRDFTHGDLIFFDAQWREVDRLALVGEGLVLDIAALPPDNDFLLEQRTFPNILPTDNNLT